MTFAEIIPLLLEGKTIIRGDFKGCRHILEEHKKQGESIPDHFIISKEDLLADDWEVIE